MEYCTRYDEYCMDRCGRSLEEFFKGTECPNMKEYIPIPEDGKGSISDGHHTFDELYHHRAVLFSIICNQNWSKAWKSKKHSDGTMFNNMFIVGIDTPKGIATYHCEMEEWDKFKDIIELDFAPEWDGYSPEESLERLVSLIESKKN